MDRFSEETPADLARNYARSRFGYETFAAPDEPEAEEEEICPERQEVFNRVWRFPVPEYLAAMNAHEVQCARCCCEKKDVVPDRLVLDSPDSTCCGEVA